MLLVEHLISSILLPAHRILHSPTRQTSIRAPGNRPIPDYIKLEFLGVNKVNLYALHHPHTFAKANVWWMDGGELLDLKLDCSYDCTVITIEDRYQNLLIWKSLPSRERDFHILVLLQCNFTTIQKYEEAMNGLFYQYWFWPSKGQNHINSTT